MERGVKRKGKRRLCFAVYGNDWGLLRWKRRGDMHTIPTCFGDERLRCLPSYIVDSRGARGQSRETGNESVGNRGQKTENKAKRAKKSPPREWGGLENPDIALLHGLFNRNGNGDSRADHRVVAQQRFWLGFCRRLL